MLEKLDAPLCTPDSPLYTVCKYFVAENCDFGTAYAHLRPHLYDFVTDRHVNYVMETMDNDDKMRRNMLVNKQIFNGDAPPRRVWDLHANRVVPWWVARKYPWAISHAWVEDKDLKSEMTPINGYEWPVPMPKDADLNLIRIEMLSLGAEYAWLDVLCLRQKGQGDDPRGNPSQEEWEHREALRKEVRKVDLPTIGWIYHKAEKVVCYFNGLGLPLSFKPGNFESDHCWFNRAWTLQEINDNLLIAGETRHDGRFMAKLKDIQKRIRDWFNRANIPQEITEDPAISGKTRNDSRFMKKDMQKLFNKKLASLRQMQRGDSIFDVLSQVQKRKSTNPVDKVAGLVYLFYSQYIPIYNADQSEEDAWTELVNITQDWFRTDFFFLYAGPGNGNKFWHPSWEQVMTEMLPRLSASTKYHSVEVYRTREDGDEYYGPRIDSCRVQGLADNSTPEIPRHGKLDVTDGSGGKHTFEIIANHAFPIPDDLYTLIGTTRYIQSLKRSFWVIGKTEGPEGKFKKVSVFSMVDRLEAEKLLSINVDNVYTRIYLL